MKRRLAIIDLDPLVHIVANVQWYAGNKDDEAIVRGHASRFYDTVLKNCDSSRYICFYQAPGHKNYRNDILPEYKSHRVASEGAIRWKAVVCDVLKEKGAHALFQIESDDAMYLLANKAKKDKEEYLIVENDKDMAMIAGNHYNPFKKQPKDKPKIERWYSFTEDEGRFNFWCQVLSGDATDIPNEFGGMAGVGPAKAAKILGTLTDNEWMYPHRTMKAYVEKYGFSKGLRRMSITFDMVNLLREPTEDYPESKEILEVKPRVFYDHTEKLFDNRDTSTDSLI